MPSLSWPRQEVVWKMERQDAESKHAFGWYLIRSALSGLRTPNKEAEIDERRGPDVGRRYSLDLMESMEPTGRAQDGAGPGVPQSFEEMGPSWSIVTVHLQVDDADE
eukprot:Skav213624  [mRNA]  locus=scaffold2986:596196:598623:+ [translate_table: standard]